MSSTTVGTVANVASPLDQKPLDQEPAVTRNHRSGRFHHGVEPENTEAIRLKNTLNELNKSRIALMESELERIENKLRFWTSINFALITSTVISSYFFAKIPLGQKFLAGMSLYMSNGLTHESIRLGRSELQFRIEGEKLFAKQQPESIDNEQERTKFVELYVKSNTQALPEQKSLGDWNGSHDEARDGTCIIDCSSGA